MVKRKDKFDISEACGWLGMVLIHAATLPTSLGVILGYSDKLPPLSIEPVVVLNKNPGYIAYLANGMKL